MDDRGRKALIEKIRDAMLDPCSYPHEVEKVGLKETHISLIFLTGSYVYKVKKPVNFGFLDFTSPQKRRFFCEREVELNKRLAPEVYLGVSEIKIKGERITVDGDGTTVDYAVRMKQFDEDLLLSKLLAQGKVTEQMMVQIARRLAEFYRTAETNQRIMDFARPERIREDTDENFSQTEKYRGVTISEGTFVFIKEKTDLFLKKRELFESRIRAGRIRDCHGDLRLEHIFFGENIVIFDCIEFNERFRYIDTASDIAFLSMDLAFNGREDLDRSFLQAYVEASSDEQAFQILDFYRCYRAYVRGKVESFKLDDPLMGEREKEEAKERAKRYFELSSLYAMRL